MKYIITESSLKRVMFRFWDKVGGKIDSTFLSFFGLKEISSSNPTVLQYLVEWRGEKKTKELTESLLFDNPHHVTAGGYDFYLNVNSIEDWKLNMPYVIVNIDADTINGAVTLFDGRTLSLQDAINDEEIGWEVKDEIDWAIYEYFRDNITSETGVLVLYNKIDN